MARIKTISVTLCAVILTTFTFIATPQAVASEHARPAAVHKSSTAASAKVKKKSAPAKKTASKSTKSSTTDKKKRTTVKKRTTTSSSTPVTARQRTASRTLSRTASVSASAACRKNRSAKQRAACLQTRSAKGVTIADAHKIRVQKAQKTAMSKLMQQIGKPYRWGGNSPRTGFDCSGLVWYAYKDLVKFRIPRTANEMYHLRDASPVDRGALETGDLVFFRTQGRGTADHVGVYMGNGKFIQSPSSGQGIQVTSLSEDYWKRHYVGARRVMTSSTIR